MAIVNPLARRAWWFGVLTLGLYAVLFAVYLGFPLIYPGFERYAAWRESIFVPIFALMGVLILRRLPAHPIGWAFQLTALAGAVQQVAGQYAVASLTMRIPGLQGGAWAAWLEQLSNILALSGVFFLMLFFPTGALLSNRWRPVGWCLIAGVSAQVIVRAFYPGLLDVYSVPNPAGAPFFRGALEGIAAVGGPVFVAGIAGTIIILVVRAVRSRGVERQQIKMFVFVAVFNIVAIALSGFEEHVFPEPLSRIWKSLGGLVWVLGPSSLAVAAALAVLRYRLYDIDVIIRRTLQYSVLTGLLALVYYSGVVVMQGVFDGLAGGTGTPLITVVNTLLLAALFNPLRIRIQHWIDRRFYREKFNAEAALADFSRTARDEVDLDRLATALIKTVNGTMRPEKTSLWLKNDRSGS